MQSFIVFELLVLLAVAVVQVILRYANPRMAQRWQWALTWITQRPWYKKLNVVFLVWFVAGLFLPFVTTTFAIAFWMPFMSMAILRWLGTEVERNTV